MELTEYHYVYYSYEEYGRGYFGSRTCKCLPEEDVKYFGSFHDRTFNPTQKIILKSDYATREEAYADEIILQEYYKVIENPHFANKSYQTSTKFYYTPSFEEASMRGKKQHKNKLGMFQLTTEERVELGKRNGAYTRDNKLGIFTLTSEELSASAKKAYANGLGKLSKEVRSEYGKIGAKVQKENGTGIFSLTPEQRIENGKKSYENGVGIYSLTQEELKEIANRKYECCETGYISNAAGVVRYQRARGIDTSKNNRRKIS